MRRNIIQKIDDMYTHGYEYEHSNDTISYESIGNVIKSFYYGYQIYFKDGNDYYEFMLTGYNLYVGLDLNTFINEGEVVSTINYHL